jgi:outer membrane receptor protein involved in Fe transport
MASAAIALMASFPAWADEAVVSSPAADASDTGRSGSGGGSSSSIETIDVTGKRHVTPKTDLNKTPTAEIATTYSLTPSDIKGIVTDSTVDLIRSIPGVYGATFGIGGIANGLGLRGWAGSGDANNIATYVDNYQRNNLSGGNSNGYDDLNPLIPETIGSLDLVKGPFSTRYGGPFSFAGSLIITTADYVPTGFSQEFGSFIRSRSLATFGYQGADYSFYSALEGFYEGGYRENSTYDRINSFSKFTTPVGDNGTLRVSLQIYNANYGQALYPRLTDLKTDLLQATNPLDYGNKSQFTGTANYSYKDDNFNLDASLFFDKSYVHRSATRDTNTNPAVSPLLQNITRDDRWVYGGNVDPYWEFELPGNITAAIRAGASVEDSNVTQARFPGLNNLPVAQPNFVNAANQIAGATYWGTFNEINSATYLEGELKPLSWLKLTASLRYDYFNYDVDAVFPKGAALPVFDPTGKIVLVPGKPGILLPESYDDYTGRLTGRGGVAILFDDHTTFYANIGQGVNPPAALADLGTNNSLKTVGMTSEEAGLSYDNPELGVHFGADAYYTINNGEIATVGGIATNVGKSRRLGADVDTSVYVFDNNGYSLKLTAAYSVVRARVVGNDAARYITGVPDYVASWGWDFNTPVRLFGLEGESLRWTAQDEWIGAQKILASGTLRAPEFSRITTKIAYDLPSYHSLEVYLGGIIYPGSTTSECCVYTSVNGIPMVSVQPTYQISTGLSVKF